jgi:hypothetical protein
MITDMDERQEYETLRLEGFSENEARKRARSANDRINSERLRGPRSGDTRHGHGTPPLVTDFLWTDLWEQTTPLTMDTRSPEDREDDWAMADRLHALMSLCTDRQRTILSDIYGLETGTPMTYPAVAEKHGMTLPAVISARTKGIARIRRLVENPPMTDEQKRAHRRELKRRNKQRERARRASRM